MVGKAVFADGVIVAQKVTVHAVVVPDIEGGVFVFIKLRVFHIRVGVEVGIAVEDAVKMLIVPVAAEAFGGEGETVAVVTGAEVGAHPVVVKIEAHALALVVHGVEVFDKCHEEGLIEKVITTNLTYQMPDLFKKDWYESADMSKYIALIIDHLNHDASISELLDPAERINARIAEYKEKHTISDNYEM